MADLTELQASLVTRVVGATTDGTEQTAVGSTPNQDLKVTDTLTVGGLNGNLVVSGTPVEAKVNILRLVDRKILIVKPLDSKVYWGFNNTVTTLTGMPIEKDQEAYFNAFNIPIYLISAGSSNVRVVEGK
jgi:hypothetical protein